MAIALASPRSILSAVVLWAGCGPPAPTAVDGGPAKVLEILDPPGAQIGLHYGSTMDLMVRYHLDDATATPIAGATVKLAIFDDPGGSTLASDRAITRADGVASVRLTAGAQEKSFRVRAQAPDAPDALFGISVSSQAFVNIDVELSYGGTAPIVTLESKLFTGTSCARLGPNPSDASAFRILQIASGSLGTLHFLNLLSQNYAIVGQALDAAGRLQASGCVDVAASLVPAGATAGLPLPLVTTTPGVAGSYALSTTLTVDLSTAAAATAEWNKLTACAEAPAQGLLDRIEAGVPAAPASAMEGKRGAVDGKGCRPALAGGTASLDAQLQALLTGSGTPGQKLAAIVGDLDAIVAAATLTSTLTLRNAGAGAIWADHALGSVTLATSGGTQSYDVNATALPIIDASDVPATFTGATLTLGAHGFTLGLGTFWRRALADLSIAARLPTLAPRTSRALLGAVVGAAMSMTSSKTSCAAVEELVCAAIGAGGCVGQIDPACVAALDPWATALDAPFAPPVAIDLTLSGSATAADTNGDLLIDLLSPGSWQTALAQSMSASFVGSRTGP